MCLSNQDVEMHHVKKIRNLRDPSKRLDFFTRQMEGLNRKQIPLCKDHHIRQDKDEWSESEKFEYPKLIKAYADRINKKKNNV